MRSIPKWLVWLFGDDRNLFHPDPKPVFKCAKCNRFVWLKKADKASSDLCHADDLTPICQPIGIYRP